MPLNIEQSDSKHDDLRSLRIGEPKLTLVLLFHNFDDARNVSLPLRWPSQHPI